MSLSLFFYIEYWNNICDGFFKDKGEKVNTDIEFLDHKLKDYGNFANMIYNRYTD